MQDSQGAIVGVGAVAAVEKSSDESWIKVVNACLCVCYLETCFTVDYFVFGAH